MVVPHTEVNVLPSPEANLNVISPGIVAPREVLHIRLETEDPFSFRPMSRTAHHSPLVEPGTVTDLEDVPSRTSPLFGLSVV